MIAQDYLEKYRQAQHKADGLKAKYAELIGGYGDIHGAAFTEIRHAGISKPTERKIEKAQAVLEKWRKAQLDALEIRQNVYALIAALPAYESLILYNRYIELKTWPQVERAADISHSNLFRMHRQGLQHIQELIDIGAIDEMKSDLDAYIKKYVDM